VHVGVLLEGSAEGVAARAARLAEAMNGGARTQVSAEPPSWWPGMPAGAGPDGAGADGGDVGGAGAGTSGAEVRDETLVQVSFWQSALPSVLAAIDAADPDGRLRPVVTGPAGAGVLYVTPAPGASAEAVARFTGALRARLHHARGSVEVLRAPAAVRSALDSCGGMTGPVPALRLMRAVKDQFDADGRMSPGRFPFEATGEDRESLPPRASREGA
jgi:glycolate oxidase FAD binding subunit